MAIESYELFQLYIQRAIDYTEQTLVLNQPTDDSDIQKNKVYNFVSRFIEGGRVYLFSDDSQVQKLVEEIHSDNALVDYVMGLNFFVHSPFTKEQRNAISTQLAFAMTPNPSNGKAQSYLPEDQPCYITTFVTNDELLEANPWLCALLLLSASGWDPLEK